MRKYVITGLAALTLAAMPALAQNVLPGLDGAITMIGANGEAAGTATVRQAKKGVIVELSLQGLLPGWHGVQLHAVGDCADTAAYQRSGPIIGLPGEHHGLYNPAGPMDGDLPNIWIGADGAGRAQFNDMLILPQELADADGAAIIVRSGPDDLKTEPDGQSGTRVACGIISPNKVPPP